MEDSTYLLIDTALKIGLGAIIAGFSGYFISMCNHKNDLRVKYVENQNNLIKDLAFKLEDIESSANKVALYYYNEDIDSAKSGLLPVTQFAYEARAISNLIGHDELVSDLEAICLLTESFYEELIKVNPSHEKLYSLGHSLKERKMKVYPHLRQAYQEINS